MRYEGIVIRPPSEADSLIIQITYGCSHNRCAFCPTYKGTKFRKRPMEDVKKDIDEAARSGWFWKRAFLCDGDALILPTDHLAEIIGYLRKKLPTIGRVGIYGNAKSVLRKSVDELRRLRKLGLGIVYLGLESGDAEVLKEMNKWGTPEGMIEAARRIRDAGILLSVTVLLGLAGRDRKRALRHAKLTARVLNEMKPEYASALTVMVVPNTPLYERMERGEFELPHPFEILEELRELLSHLELDGCLFTSNHASNYLPLRVRLPDGKQQALDLLDRVIETKDDRLLRPEWMRGL
ncbi:MAG TPA: radical SAM protein [Proteobacteria bacterium]|nr:radical SAM protein [Pseudomonadota bacterium]